jgi:hypothetical protein
VKALLMAVIEKNPFNPFDPVGTKKNSLGA